MSDDRIQAVSPDGDDVIKGSNFPTPMGMAPTSADNGGTPGDEPSPVSDQSSSPNNGPNPPQPADPQDTPDSNNATV